MDQTTEDLQTDRASLEEKEWENIDEMIHNLNLLDTTSDNKKIFNKMLLDIYLEKVSGGNEQTFEDTIKKLIEKGADIPPLFSIPFLKFPFTKDAEETKKAFETVLKIHAKRLKSPENQFLSIHELSKKIKDTLYVSSIKALNEEKAFFFFAKKAQNVIRAIAIISVPILLLNFSILTIPILIAIGGCILCDISIFFVKDFLIRRHKAEQAKKLVEQMNEQLPYIEESLKLYEKNQQKINEWQKLVCLHSKIHPPLTEEDSFSLSSFSSEKSLHSEETNQRENHHSPPRPRI